MTTTTTNTTTSTLPEAHAEWRRAHALLVSMYVWANDVDAQAELREEVGRARCVPDWLLARVHSCRKWYLIPNVSAHPTLAAYIDATRAALDADVRAYQAEGRRRRGRPPPTPPRGAQGRARRRRAYRA
jgi:hypothetical protein